MRPYSPGGPLITLAEAVRGSIPPPPGGHRLGPGLPGYLILFAPPAFVPERQRAARTLPSPSVFLRISTHFTAPPGIPRPSPPLQARAVWTAPSQVSREISLPTCRAACAPFTPSNSGQRSPPTYYRGCWHVVSRGFFLGYRPYTSSPRKAVYNPKAVIPHAASLGQAFAHCRRSLTAAPRRSLGRSQSQCGWPSSQTSYRSSPWCAVTTPTS